MDPLTIAAIAAAIASFGIKAFGSRGHMVQIGGPSEADIAAEQNALRERQTHSIERGARSALQAGAANVSQRGVARSGAVGGVAGNVGARMGEDLAGLDSQVAGYGAQLRGLRSYDYRPSQSEQFAGLLGSLSGPLFAAGALRSAAEKQSPLDAHPYDNANLPGSPWHVSRSSSPSTPFAPAPAPYAGPLVSGGITQAPGRGGFDFEHWNAGWPVDEDLLARPWDRPRLRRASGWAY